jgi:hypothetical protein
MEQIKNSCNNRGCKIRIILPFDRGVKSIYARDIQKRNDISPLLPLAGLPLDKKQSKKAA